MTDDTLVAAVIDPNVTDAELWWLAWCWSVQHCSPLLLAVA